MKTYWSRSIVDLSQLNQIERFAFLSVVILSLAILLSSCGGGLGKIRVEDVDTSITDAQIAIQSANFTSAAKYEPTTLNHAQSLLNDAKKAEEEKKGVEALRLAQSAKFQAELAVSRSQQREAIDEEIKTLTQEKQTEIDAIKNNLQVAELESTKMKLDVQRLESRLEQIESDKRDLVMQLSEQRNADWKAKQAENRVEELEQQLTEIQTQLHSALLKQQESENLAQEFSNKLSTNIRIY